jgi:hypothetical protein
MVRLGSWVTGRKTTEVIKCHHKISRMPCCHHDITDGVDFDGLAGKTLPVSLLERGHCFPFPEGTTHSAH